VGCNKHTHDIEGPFSDSDGFGPFVTDELICLFNTFSGSEWFTKPNLFGALFLP
jgi:hypothetical protein